MSKKKIMRCFKISEISAVDRPAQGGARMAIMKRDSEGGNKMTKQEADVLKRLRLTSSVDGHSHLINDTEEGGETSWTKAEGAEYGHSHPWVKNDDGSISLGEADGHTHDVLDTTFKSIHSEESEGGTGDGTKINTAESLGSNTKESPMTEKVAAENAAEIEALKSDLAVAKAYGSLTDAEKAHYNSLTDEDQKSFLSKSADQRKDDVAKAASSDPVVYKSVEGVEYRKSDDPRLVALAKSADEHSKIAKAEREQRENAEFAKRANEELKHLPGEEASKVALLKAVDAITDSSIKTQVQEMLKANNDKMAKAFESLGSSAGEGKTSQDQLDALAKKYSADHKVTFEKAMTEVLSTKEGKELYNSISSK